jgi:hypothetical protein
MWKGADPKAIKQRLQELKTARAGWGPIWRDIGTYILPRRSFDTKPEGRNFRTGMYDSTAERANNRLAAVISSMLTNPSTKWFTPRIVDKFGRGLESKPLHDMLNKYAEEVRDIALGYINDSNFPQSSDELYLDMGGIGTGIMLVLKGFDEIRKPLLFKTLPIAECYLSENASGVVDTLYREYECEVRKLAQEFGEGALSPQYRAKLKDNPEEKIKVIHAIQPRENYSKNPVSSKDLPIASVYIEAETERVLSEGGFREFPAVCPRWRKASGEVYGRGPGHEALADVQTLNEQVYTSLSTGHRQNDPPIDVEEDAYTEPLDLSPLALNVRQRGHESAKPIITSVVGSGEMLNFIKHYTDTVRESFFWYNLSLVENDRMTATEVMQRTTENMRVLGPTFGRFMTEFLEPLIRRVLSILDEAGLLPAPPVDLTDADYRIEYESPLARAMRATDLQAIEHSIMTLAPILQVAPETRDIVKWDDTVRDIFVLNGVPRKRLNTDTEVKAIREERAKQQAEQMAMAQAETAARAAKDASEADPTKGLLGAVLRG